MYRVYGLFPSKTQQMINPYKHIINNISYNITFCVSYKKNIQDCAKKTCTTKKAACLQHAKKHE